MTAYRATDQSLTASFCRRAATLFGAAVLFNLPLIGQPSAQKIQLIREQVLDAEKEDFPVVNGGRVNARLDIALTIRQDFQVRVYDAAGKRLAMIGRKGQAPGEFLQPQAQGWIADTVWIYDATLRRHSFFTRNGQLIRTVRLETTGRAVRVRGDSASARLTDFFPWVRRSDSTSVGSATIVRDGRSGKHKESVLAALVANGTAVKLANTEQDSRWDADLAITRAAAVSPTGREFVLASVTDLSVSGSQILDSHFDERGVLRGVAKLPYTGVPYPPDKRDRVLRGGIEPDHNQSVIASRVPKVLPPIMHMLLRDDGIVLLTLQKTVETQSALLLDARGTVRGEFILPRKADVIATRGANVWLSERNDDDLVSIVRYRMMCRTRSCFVE